jgi:hypothetical protein
VSVLAANFEDLSAPPDLRALELSDEAWVEADNRGVVRRTRVTDAVASCPGPG